MTNAPEVEEYKQLISNHLRETEGRGMYSNTEVRDILLDLWLALSPPNPN
jgi:hypothetical protein